MQAINELATEIRAVGVANGWTLVYRPDWDSSEHHIPCMLALIHSEIVEAHDELRVADTDYDDLAAEFADILIRILDLAGGLTEDFQTFVDQATGAFIPADDERAFNGLHATVTAALEHFRQDTMASFLKTLANLFFMVECYATHKFNIDLNVAVPAKIEVNRHRSHRHGGKRV